MKKQKVSDAVIHRLPRYYRYLDDLFNKGVVRISSHSLGDKMDITASQIRQDLSCFGEFGQQGYGYLVEQLYEELYHILGMDQLTPAIILGAGNLGHALINHMNFAGKGVRLDGIFDDAPTLIGQTIHDITVQSTDALETFCTNHSPKLAILCIPKEAAPHLVERLVACGVKAFWNFSHYDIAMHHKDVLVENVHLGDSLMALSYLINQEK